MFELHQAVISKLALHQLQRNQLIPTISVLVGQMLPARQLWMQNLRNEQRATATVVYHSQDRLFDAWLSVVAKQVDLPTFCMCQVAELADRPAEELTSWLANTSHYQKELFWQQLDQVSENASFLRSMLHSLFASAPSIPYHHCDSDKMATDGQLVSATQRFAIVARLIPQSALPGLLVLPPAQVDTGTFSELVIALTQLVEEVPTLPVGLALTPVQRQWTLDPLPESKAKALLRNGLITLASPHSTTLRHWLQNQGIDNQENLQQITHLVEHHGATIDTLQCALAILDPTVQTEFADLDTPYRSHAEWLLFQYLEARAETAGRFQVNQRIDIDFGGRAMEVDFLDAEAKLVIELDGHYHFTDLESYRRDRRKDRLLQQHGYLVLRFLSEDIVSHLETIFDAVDQSLAIRQT